MIVFLLKSSACLAIFLMFYKLLLEKECMHTFKRYYLLVALVLAMVIPSITFTEYVEVIPTTTMIAPVDMISTETAMAIRENTTEQEVNKTGIHNWTLALWMLYGLGVLLFSLKFFFNLQIIALNIRNNQKLKIDSIINVLLKDAVVPHTFLNYIFLNRQQFECNEIPKDVLVHEATHARQKHSLDVLFVELLQIVFWFNPLIHWVKKSIKLNHEFLADAAVIHQGSATADYQNILLTFASSANYKSNQPSMANAINYSSYSSIKKRFTVMKTQTSKKSILIRNLLLLPLFSLLLYSFSGTKIIERQQPLQKVPSHEQKLVQQIDKNKDTPKITQKGPSASDFEQWKNKGEFAIWIHGKPADNSVLSNYKPSDFTDYFLSFVSKNARNEKYPQPYQLHLYTHEEVEKNAQNDEIITVYINKKSQLLIHDELVEITNLVSFLSKMNSQLSKEERKKVVRAEIIPDNSAPKDVIAKVENILKEYGVAQIDVVEGQVPFLASSQKGATKEQIFKYNALAKKYNALPKEKRVIPSGDLKSLETIYGKMTNEQKTDAQPFPECPDPKSSNQEGATKKQVGEYNGLAKTYNKMLANTGNIHIKRSDVDRFEYLHSIMTEDQRAQAEPFPDFPEPPEPPMPPSPLEPNDEVYAEKIIEEIIVNQDPYDDLGRNINLSVDRNGKKKPYPNKNHSTIRTVEEVENKEEVIKEIIENQEIIAEERPLITTPFWLLNSEKEAEVYLEGKEITYAKMKKMERNGMITSMTITKIPNGNSIIKLNETSFQPPTPPNPPAPKSPLELLKELKKDNVKIIFDGKEIGCEEAETLFEENTFSRVNLRKGTEGRPVLEVSKD
ncbi:Signal transducer regulating beta-lactamase production, contains metallopeptidase domain [Pricia antarctica]|uniref:Signal transducer regulating beta-lactamase production, contains metallopeptidase domain n=1 Tax=Pricia antarctica TaxID=641691 RepID=A0A1G6Z2H5_9FLAO|nr:M56 family metallopeptidase [Pricia antarctica]SDD96944.1 Signal transducer regulating beta-lactamase production, contains metallopeptidase domain [Pricia antarctica]